MWPFGAHICVVEVDTETGHVDVVKYVAVDDVGRIVNPQIVDGQVMGGVIQGIAEALYEEAALRRERQLMTVVALELLRARGVRTADITIGGRTTWSTSNEMGFKGVGETGTIASPPAVINAVNDALSHLGDIDVGRPATPERVWRAIQGRGDAAPEEASGPGAGAGTGSAERSAAEGSDGGDAQ